MSGPTYQTVVAGSCLEVQAKYLYNQSEYRVRLLEGEWPTDEALLKHFHAVDACGGGSVKTAGSDVKVVHVWGCD